MGNRFFGLLLVLLLLPLHAFAAFSQSDLNELEQKLWQVRAEFHMYTVMEGHQDYADSLTSAITAAERSLSGLGAKAEGDRQRQLVTRLVEYWQNFKKAANSNTVASLGYSDNYVLQQVNEIPATMVQLLGEYDQAAKGDYDDLYALSALMQQMTAEYLTLAANPFGGMATGSDTGRLDFAQAVPRFEQLLASALNQHQEPAVARSLQQVDVKWRFVRESMIKFYENAVPFLIYRYTDQIVSTLQQTADMQRQDMPAAPTFGPAN